MAPGEFVFLSIIYDQNDTLMGREVGMWEILSEYNIITLIDKDGAGYTLQLWFFLGQAPEPVQNIPESFCGIRMSMMCYYWNKNLGLQCQETGD